MGDASCHMTGLTFNVVGRDPDGRPIVNFGYRYGPLTSFAGGRLDRDPGEELERQMWAVPPAGVLALQSLAAIFERREFSPVEFCARVKRGLTRPLIDAFGDRLQTPEECDRFLASLVEHPPESDVVLLRRGRCYRVEVAPARR